MKWLSHLLDEGTQYDSLRAARTAVSVTIAAATAYGTASLGKSVAVRSFMSNAALHRPPTDHREHFDTAQVLSFVLLLVTLAGSVEDLEASVRRALSETLWGIDGHSRSSDTHCLFRERLLDLHRHRSAAAGTYCTRASLYWPKEVRPGSARRNSSGRTGHWSKIFDVWSTTPAALCTLSWLRSMFLHNSSAAFVKVAVAGREYTPAWHCSRKSHGVFPVISVSTVATEVASAMAAAGLRDGETAHQLRGASSSKAVQLSNGKLKAQVLSTARWSGDSQFQTSYQGFVRCWCLDVPPPTQVANPQQAQRWGVLSLHDWLGAEVLVTATQHTQGQAMHQLVHAQVTAVDETTGRTLARRSLPRARLLVDRRRLLRAMLPIFTVQAFDKSWIRRSVPFAVIADGYRRWVHHGSCPDVALSDDRWC
jgi:hypothetical protein